MGPDMDANWGITVPWLDQLIGKRKKFLQTDELSPVQRILGQVTT